MSENLVGSHIFVSVCVCPFINAFIYVHAHAHLYMNSYIYELLIYLCIQSFISAFETSLWLIADGFRWLQVALIAFVPNCINFPQAL